MTSVDFSEESSVRLAHEMRKKNVQSVASCLLVAVASPSGERESYVGRSVGHLPGETPGRNVGYGLFGWVTF